MWEYNRFVVEFNYSKELLDKLNKIGEQGWEIIYYQETKPPKFGDKWISTVLTKKLKPACHE